MDINTKQTSDQQQDMVPVTHPSQFKQRMDNLSKHLKSLGVFIWNNDTREVLGRDGLSWSKVMGCYFVFYALLGSFFVGLLAIFVATLSMEAPTYYADTSVMSTRNRINPGLGFRPQLDVEDSLIAYSMQDMDQIDKLTRNMRIYLNRYFDSRNDTSAQIDDCPRRDLEQLRDEIKQKRTSCAYDYQSVLAATDCSPSNMFGYPTGSPCVIVKLNRIYGWTPQVYESVNDVGFDQREHNVSLEVLEKNIVVICDGEYGTDRDNLAETNITYYSVNSRELDVFNVGLMPVYFYPYLNQREYKAPLVFVQFKGLPRFVSVNIVCRAYARNIDSIDKLYLRGMTIFQLFVGQ